VKDLRAEQELIDREIVALITRRAELAVRIAESIGIRSPSDWPKLHQNLSVRESLYDAAQAPAEQRALRHVFHELTGMCRRSALVLRIGYLGPEFSYSHAAAMAYFGSGSELLPVATIASVFQDVARGNFDAGVVPLENSTDGRIVDSLSMFARHTVQIAAEVPLKIHHCLLGSESRSDIRTVSSKPQALSQCRQWLAEHLPRARIVEASSTSAAAEQAASDPTIAAIASRAAAARYNLQVLAENIEDNSENVTRFAVIGNISSPRTGNDKTAVIFQVSHEPGALADVMAIFKRNRLNLTWIESFPIATGLGKQEYLFLVEFEGHHSELRPKRAMSTLKKYTSRLDLLGSYPRGAVVE
jgi:chorismate mutase/prephenate dehydratase